MPALKLENVPSHYNLVQEICAVIGKLTGNVFSEKQYAMVESRLKRRALELKLEGLETYHQYWMKNQESENGYLIGLLTTHFTSFFREFNHFEWIEAQLPEIVATVKAQGRNRIDVWSAACSKGQEVWSLAMWFHFHLPKVDPSMTFSILGTDIDITSVNEAENGVYHRRELETAPRHLWEQHWVRGKGDISDWYKAKSSLRQSVTFSTNNLLVENSSSQKFDLIFCRNVLIYFSRPDQMKASQSLLSKLNPMGTLITGVSESLNGMELDTKCLAPSVYKRSSDYIKEEVQVIPLAKKANNLIPEAKKVLKVLCVDDSPTVLTILKKILKTEDFEVLDTACDGLDAKEKYGKLKPDLITLDLHMPNMDGLTFLKETGVAKIIPVIVVSSVSRDDSFLTNELFSLGVSDFVEKPSLQNIKEIGDELKQKLKSAWKMKEKGLNVSFNSKMVKNREIPPHNLAVVIGAQDFDHLKHVFRSAEWGKTNLYIVLEAKDLSLKVEIEKFFKMYKVNSVKVVEAKGLLLMDSRSLPLFWLVFKHADVNFIRKNRLNSQALIIEEVDNLMNCFSNSVTDTAPYTSMGYNLLKLIKGE